MYRTATRQGNKAVEKLAAQPARGGGERGQICKTKLKEVTEAHGSSTASRSPYLAGSTGRLAQQTIKININAIKVATD